MEVTGKIIEERDAAERRDWDALARYKFWMFGYHAATWVKYNGLLPPGQGRAANPFAELVGFARGRL